MKNNDALDAPVKMPCGCSWHETTSWTICDECSKLECFQPPEGHKTPLQLFDGNDLNLKSNAGIKQYAFNSYAIRRIRNALEKYEDLNTRPQPCADAVKALDRLANIAFVNTNNEKHDVKDHVEMVETIRDAIIQNTKSVNTLSWIDADLQNDICGIVTKYGVQDIYTATDEILFEVLKKGRAALTQPRADVDLMARVYEEERAKYLGGTVYYTNNHEAFKGCMNKALAAQGYIGGGWQPIETAPKDGEYFLVCLPRMMNLIIRARFDRVHKQWLSERDNDGAISRVEFFHAGDFWMPMPKPPAAPKKEVK